MENRKEKRKEQETRMRKQKNRKAQEIKINDKLKNKW